MTINILPVIHVHVHYENNDCTLLILIIIKTSLAVTSQFDDVDTATITGLLEGREKELSPLLETDNLTPSDITKKPKAKRSKAKGLGHVADMVEDMFIKVAVSESKLKPGATKKEVIKIIKFFIKNKFKFLLIL